MLNWFKRLAIHDQTGSLQVYRLLRFGFLLVTSIALAQWNFSTDLIGYYEWMVHLLYASSFFWIHGLFQYLLIRSGKDQAIDKERGIRIGWVVVCLISILLFVVFNIFPSVSSFFIFGVAEVRYWWPFSLFILLGLAPLAFEYFILLKERPRHLLLWGGISYPLYFLVTMVPLWMGKGIEGMLWSHVGFNGVRCFVILLYLGLPSFESIPTSWISSFVKLSLYTIIGGIPVFFDTWFVGYFYGDQSQVAVFRYGAREFPLIMILLGSIHIVALPRLSSVDQHLGDIRRSLTRSLHLLGPSIILLALFSPLLYPIVFNEEFYTSAFIFNIYLLILIPRLILSHTLVMSFENYALLNGVAVLEVSLNIVLSILLVQSYGLMGIALATVIAFLFEKVLLSIWLYKKKGISPGQYVPLRPFFIYSFFVLSCVCASYLFIYPAP